MDRPLRAIGNGPGGQSAVQRPRRSGQPWAEKEYEALISLTRAGESTGTIAEKLERTEQAILARARQMLPLDQRGGPIDRSIVTLRTRPQEDPDYDWAAAMTLTPPRPAIVHQPVVLDGFAGVPAGHLATIAEALTAQGTDQARRLLYELSPHLDQTSAWSLMRRRRGEALFLTSRGVLSSTEARHRAEQSVEYIRDWAKDIDGDHRYGLEFPDYGPWRL